MQRYSSALYVLLPTGRLRHPHGAPRQRRALGDLKPPRNILNMRKELTEQQKAERDARREKFKALWKQVAAMPQDQRVALSHKYGFRTVTGHALSPGNQMMIALQLPTASVLGGFRQWIKAGRAVRKGQHGAMIWVPTGGQSADTTPLSDEVTEGADVRFIVGTVFDIGQTEDLNPQGQAAA